MKNHWKKVDHITFLIALILVVLNIFINSREISIIAAVFMIIALVYDVFYE